MKKQKHISSASRWLVLIIDIGFSFMAISIAMIVLAYLNPERVNRDAIVCFAYIILSIRIIGFLIFRTYSGIVRYTSAHDIMRIIIALTVGEVVILGINGIFSFKDYFLEVPFEFIEIEFISLGLLMIVSRILFKKYIARYFMRSGNKKNVVIYGNPQDALMVKQVIGNCPTCYYNVVGFIDSEDKERKKGKILSGTRIYRLEELDKLLNRKIVDRVIIAEKYLSKQKKKELIEICLKYKVEVFEIPNIEKLISEEISVSQIKSIKIEDLLNRGVIELDDKLIYQQINNKIVLVTGAAGSIGSEIVRQLTRYNPLKIILLDIAETPLYDLELELKEKLKFDRIEVELCNIRNMSRLREVFKRKCPNIVYHAAAYKHVPMLEHNPIEAVMTNVFGTVNVADLAVSCGCEVFVMVSTDKAVNPTSIMGCTKRLAEIYVQSLSNFRDTSFVTTRFGNVLGSSGSVIPRFMQQIEEGGPITITHPEITRFFMTIPEASQLVLQAGTLGKGADIFVFDMGKSIKILDLAKNMIKLAGLEEGKDIQIVFTGLRPGEKLYEEVLAKEEDILPTEHKLIFRAKVRDYDYKEVSRNFERLKSVVTLGDYGQIICMMLELVPEFHPVNLMYTTSKGEEYFDLEKCRNINRARLAGVK